MLCILYANGLIEWQYKESLSRVSSIFGRVLKRKGLILNVDKGDPGEGKHVG